MTQPLLGEGEDVTAMFSVPSAKDGDDVTAMFSVPSVNEGKDANAMFSVPSAEDGEDVTSQFNASAAPPAKPDTSFSSAIMQGIDAPLEAIGITAQVLGAQTIGKAIRGMTEAPVNYESASEQFSNPKEGDFTVPSPFGDFAPAQIPRAITEQFGQITGSLISRVAGGIIGGAIGGGGGTAAGSVTGPGAAVTGGIGLGTGAVVGQFAGPFLFGALQIIGPTALERAKRNGRTDPNGEDIAASLVTAAGSGSLDALGAQYLPGGKKLVGSFVKRLAGAFYGESVTEAMQSVAEQTGESLGTKEGLKINLKQAFGEGMIGGISGSSATAISEPFRPADTTLVKTAPSTAAAVARTQPVTVTVPKVATPTMPSGSLGPPDPIVAEAEAAGAPQTAAALNQTMPPKPFAPRIEEPGTPTPYGRETDVYDITTGLQRAPTAQASSPVAGKPLDKFAPLPEVKVEPWKMSEKDAIDAGYVKAYRGESASQPSSADTSWWTTSKDVADNYAREIMGYEDPVVREAWIKKEGIPEHDIRELALSKNAEKLAALKPDVYGNPQEVGIYRNSDDSMLNVRHSVIHAPKDAVYIRPENEAKPLAAPAPELPVAAPAAPEPAPVAAPAPSRIQLRSGPATYSVVEQLAPQKGDQPGEVYFRVKNEQTGEEQTVEAGDMKPVKAKGAKVKAEPAQETTTNPFDTSETSRRLTELRDTKPRPINKYFGTSGGTTEQRANHEAKIRQWNNDHRKAQKAHKEAVEKSNAWIAEQAVGMKRKLRGSESGAIPASLFADIADFGARIYRDGMSFARWSADMVRHLGGRVRSALKELWVGMLNPKGARNLRGEVIQKRDQGGAIGAAGGRAEPITPEQDAAKTARPWKTTTTYKRATEEVIKRGDTVLDYGSGPYQNVRSDVEKAGAKYTPYDKYHGINLGAIEGKYDVVMGSNVLNVASKFPNPEGSYNRSLDEMTAALKPGGRLVVNMPTSGPLSDWMTPARLKQDLESRFNNVSRKGETFVASSAKSDKIEAALDKAIDALKPSKGTLYADPLFIQTVGRPALRAALMVARAAYRAGKTVAEAVADGIAHLKTLVKNLDEAKAREFFAAAGLDDGLPMPGELVEGGREGEYYTRVAERDQGTLSDNAMRVVRNRTTLPDSFKEDVDFAAEMLADDGDLAKSLRRTKSMASGLTEFFSGLTDRRKAALLFLIAQNAATQRETATDPKQIAALKDVEAEAIADFSDLMSQGGKLLNIAGQLYAAMPMSPDAQVMAAEKLLARITGGRAAEVEAAQAKDTLKTALDEQLKGMDESIRDIMRTKPKSSWDEIRQRIADEVVAKMDLATEAERKAATDKIIADLKKRMEKVRKELLAKMSKPGKPGNKTALDKLWKLWELGALDDDALTKVFMEKAGVKEFTPAFRDKLKKMYEGAETAPEGMPRERILGHIAVELALANPKTFGFWWNLAMSISYGNILGAFTTIFVNNPLGSLATSLEMVAMGSLSNKGARAETFKGAVKTWARSFGDGVAMMRDLWSTGENLQKITQFDSALVNSPVELLAKMAEDPSYPKSFRVAAKAVSQYKWIMRSMMAADAVIRWPAREALRFTQSAAIAKDTRRPGQSLEDAVDELNYPGGRLAAVREARTQAAKERKDGTLKTKLDERLRVIQLLQSKLSAEGTEAVTESDELANYGSLLNDQPQDFIGVIASAILKIAFPSNTKSDLQKALGGAAQPFVRFVRTSANATRVMLDYSIGYGAFRYMTRNWPVIGAESLAGGVNLIQPGGREKMSKEAAIRAGDRLTQVRIQRAYLGIALYAGLAAIYAAIDDDDEDPYIDFIGSGPTTPDERRRVRESGVRLNSIKIGNTYVPTNVGPLQPLAGILAPFQRMRDNKKYPKGTSDIVGEKVPELAGVAVAKGIADAVMNQSFTRSLADLLTIINTGKTSFGEDKWEFAGKNLAQFIPGNLRGLSQLDEIVSGKKERADGFFDTAANAIAFYAPNGRATTILGDEVDAGKSIFQKAGEKVFQFTTLADDKTLQFVVKNGLSIPDRQPKPSNGKRQTYLEYSAYMRESGKMMRNWLETKNSKTGKTGMEMLQSIPEEVPGEKGKPINLRKKEMNKLWSEFRQVALLKQ